MGRRAARGPHASAPAARIGAEERLLHTEFGAEYDAYRARTARLVPGLY
jgi:protein-S-isoprenylcysteine O-methyltransferase Ste14